MLPFLSLKAGDDLASVRVDRHVRVGDVSPPSWGETRSHAPTPLTGLEWVGTLDPLLIEMFFLAILFSE